MTIINSSVQKIRQSSKLSSVIALLSNFLWLVHAEVQRSRSPPAINTLLDGEVILLFIVLTCIEEPSLLFPCMLSKIVFGNNDSLLFIAKQISFVFRPLPSIFSRDVLIIELIQSLLRRCYGARYCDKCDKKAYLLSLLILCFVTDFIVKLF